jgi:hypothetical protein
MKKNTLLLILSFICIVSQAQLSAEQKSIKKIFINFQYFYLKNEKKFNAFYLYKGKGKDNVPPYHIQWKEVEKYFAFLRKQVPYVGEAYIKNEHKDFLFYDSCFKANPKEEIAVGFDADRWAGGQESCEYMVKWNTSKKNIYKVSIKGNTATLKIGYHIMKEDTEKDRAWDNVLFTKENGVWKIASNIRGVEN